MQDSLSVWDPSVQAKLEQCVQMCPNNRNLAQKERVVSKKKKEQQQQQHCRNLVIAIFISGVPLHLIKPVRCYYDKHGNFFQDNIFKDFFC